MTNDERTGNTQFESTAYRALANEFRRTALTGLLVDGADARMSLDEFATRIDGNGTNRHEVKTQLHHHHLPMLAATGAVKYDSTEKMVTTTDRIRVFEEFLECGCFATPNSSIDRRDEA